MNRVLYGVVFAGVMSLTGALTWAGGVFCYINTTRNCCSVTPDAPGTTPCGGTTCVDVILSNPIIDYVVEGTPGNITTIQQDPTKECKWENRICVNGACKQGTTETWLCTPTRIVAPLQSCN